VTHTVQEKIASIPNSLKLLILCSQTNKQTNKQKTNKHTNKETSKQS